MDWDCNSGQCAQSPCVRLLYDTDLPEMRFIKPSIGFGAVPKAGAAGVETCRTIKFEVQSCSPISLQITAGPTTGFSSSALSSSLPINQPSQEGKPAPREAILQEAGTRHPKPRFGLSPEDKASSEQVLREAGTRHPRPRFGLSPEDTASGEHE